MNTQQLKQSEDNAFPHLGKTSQPLGNSRMEEVFSAILPMLNGHWVSQAVYVAVKLGIADLLKEGDRNCEELAKITNTNPRALYRLMRVLASMDIFAEQEGGCFTLTPLAACLQSDVSGSVRSLVITAGESYHAWGHLLYSIQTGESAFEHLHQMNLFEYLQKNPESGKMFDHAMTNFLAREGAAIAANIATNYDCSSIHTLVDVGGGQGSLIASILQAKPMMQGILFEQASVIEGAKPLIKAEGVIERCQLVAGDFFESVPSGGDAYMLMRILHDWDDERAIAILKNCHSAMRENGQLLVIEQVIPPGNEPCFSKLSDLNMLVMCSGGRERTKAEYRVLFEAADFQLTQIITTSSDLNIIEGVRV
ncbi:MAG: acetylserotonin O-methyltransferase [Pseudanabaenales cyanobacterium]|nr:acetylserotonin O-methyltransferase [Pseudanabaenales cyanobacterium]